MDPCRLRHAAPLHRGQRWRFTNVYIDMALESILRGEAPEHFGATGAGRRNLVSVGYTDGTDLGDGGLPEKRHAFSAHHGSVHRHLAMRTVTSRFTSPSTKRKRAMNAKQFVVVGISAACVIVVVAGFELSDLGHAYEACAGDVVDTALCEPARLGKTIFGAVLAGSAIISAAVLGAAMMLSEKRKR